MTAENLRRYDYVVTGASGNVGRRLIPILAARGYRILAVGRDSSKLKYEHVEGVETADYGDLARLQACDVLIHLAVRNNNQPGTLEDFKRANVKFAMEICQEVRRMNGKRFIYISSVLSVEGGSASPYSASKELGKKRIAECLGDKLDNVYIGYFYADDYYGERLTFLERFGSFGALLFRGFKTLRPTTSAVSLADYVSGPAGTIAGTKILTDEQDRSSLYRAVVRMLDMGVAIAILLLLLPLFVILWCVIRLDSPGPAVFAQTRVGKSQVPFTLYKFRTMKRDTAAAGTHEVSRSAVTRVGNFLRATKLDELPQAVNLLRGEMTLVGPRPCLPSQKDLIAAREALGVFTLKPGITGYAQIRGIDMSRPDELADSDHLYLKLRSLLLDLRIMALTVLGHGRGDRVA